MYAAPLQKQFFGKANPLFSRAKVNTLRIAQRFDFELKTININF